MMYLEHVNIVVRNMDDTLRFYQAAFPQWKIRGQGKANWYGKLRNWLHFGDDNQYLAFNDNGEGENRDLTSAKMGLAHFAYVTSNIEQVIKRLEALNIQVDKYGPDDPYRRNVYFIDPNGYEIEFVEYYSDLPDERNRYEISG